LCDADRIEGDIGMREGSADTRTADDASIVAASIFRRDIQVFDIGRT
jgi:hypothetical protein